MGVIRVESMPVQLFGLGIIGFDHLQIVFEEDVDVFHAQDFWYVLEGIRDGGLFGAFLGGAGNDALIGLGGNDIFRVSGDDGLDQISGGAGYDSVLGGSGSDTIRVSTTLNNLSSIEEINGGAGFDQIIGTSGSDNLDFSRFSLRSIELIDLGAGNDRVIGSAANDTFRGGTGNDRFILTPGGGHDTILDFNNSSLLGTLGDTLDVSAFHFTDYLDLFSHMRLSGIDILLTLDQNTSVTLKNVSLLSLWPGNFDLA